MAFSQSSDGEKCISKNFGLWISLVDVSLIRKENIAMKFKLSVTLNLIEIEQISSVL